VSSHAEAQREEEKDAFRKFVHHAEEVYGQMSQFAPTEPPSPDVIATFASGRRGFSSVKVTDEQLERAGGLPPSSVRSSTENRPASAVSPWPSSLWNSLRRVGAGPGLCGVQSLPWSKD